MLDTQLIRSEPETVRRALRNRNEDPRLVDVFLELDTEWRKSSAELQLLRTKQKQLSQERNVKAAIKNRSVIKKAEHKLLQLEQKRRDTLWLIPNIPLSDVPIGSDERSNVTVRTWGKLPEFTFPVQDHVALGEKLGLIDTARAARVVGTRFSYLTGDAVMLEFALIQLAFDVLTSTKFLKDIAASAASQQSTKAFLPVIPPVMIKPDIYRRMGRLDTKTEEERYFLPKDDIYLVGSAEHTLGALHLDEIIPEEKLPLRYVGFSTCFRREAGSYGKDTTGILRVHQFDKIEIESFTKPEMSLAEQDFIVAIQEYLMQRLNLPYRVVLVSTGDMGGPDARQIDIETWLPAQNRYRETHSADFIGDYQARRLGTKIRRTDGRTEFAYMNDATVFAIGRTLIAILENYQCSDGTVNVPDALQHYLGKTKIR